MRKIRFLLTFVSILALLFVPGCSTDEVTRPEDGARANLSALGSDAFAVADGTDAAVNVDDATIEQRMQMHHAFQGGAFFRHHAHPRPEGAHAGRILRDLGIRWEQMRQIMPLIRGHLERIRPELDGIHEANQPLIDEANAQRDEILAALENDEITREEAREQLREISRATREAIRANPENDPFFERICESKLRLFDEIRDVLNPDQRVKWDEWVAGLDGPCLGSE